MRKGKGTRRGEEAVAVSPTVCSIGPPVQGHGVEKRRLSFEFKVCIGDMTSRLVRVEGSQTEPSGPSPSPARIITGGQNPTDCPLTGCCGLGRFTK